MEWSGVEQSRSRFYLFQPAKCLAPEESEPLLVNAKQLEISVNSVWHLGIRGCAGSQNLM